MCRSHHTLWSHPYSEIRCLLRGLSDDSNVGSQINSFSLRSPQSSCVEPTFFFSAVFKRVYGASTCQTSVRLVLGSSHLSLPLQGSCWGFVLSVSVCVCVRELGAGGRGASGVALNYTSSFINILRLSLSAPLHAFHSLLLSSTELTSYKRPLRKDGEYSTSKYWMLTSDLSVSDSHYYALLCT